MAACHKHRGAVELAVRLGFSKIKRDLLECFGAKLMGNDMLFAAACLAVAQRLASLADYAQTTVVTIAYDAGLWYQDLQKSVVARVA